jgi:hypothetical protein
MKILPGYERNSAFSSFPAIAIKRWRENNVVLSEIPPVRHRYISGESNRRLELWQSQKMML